MITNTSFDKSHEEIILENSGMCAQLETGNPFLSEQDIIFTENDEESSEGSKFCELEETFEEIDSIKDFFKEVLGKSIERNRRLVNNPDLIANIALNYLKLGDYDKAIENFNKAISIKNDHFPAISKLAECYSLKGDIPKAIEIYEDKIEDKENNIRFLSNISILYLKNGDIDKADIYLEKAIKIQPNNPSILNSLGIINLTKGNPSLAISFIKKAIKNNGKESNFYNNLGVCYVAISNLKKAVHYFRIAHTINKSGRSTIHNLSNAYLKLKDYESAILVLSDYLETHPNDFEQRNKIARCYYDLKIYKKSINELFKTLKSVDESELNKRASIYNNIAVNYDKIGDSKKAYSYFKKCLKIDSEPSDIMLFNILDYLFKYRDINAAKKILDLQLPQRPDNPFLLSYMANYFHSIGEYNKSELMYNKALEIDKTCVEPYLGLSTIYLDVYEDMDKSLEILNKGIELHPNHTAIINNYCYCLILTDKLKEARALIDRLPQVEDVYLNATIGLLLIKEGNIEEGRRLYNHAADLAGDNRKLRALVLQKKELELSLHFLGKGNNKEALYRIKKGLKYRTVEKHYEQKLSKLVEEI